MKADAPDPALQIATRGLRAERPDATARLVRRWDRLPGVFVLEVAPGDERWVIVLDDDVDLARGLAPACRYLTTLGTRRAAALQVGDLFALFEAYEAWPTPPNDADYPPANRPFWSRGALPEADPKLRVSAHRLMWTVSYERASPIPPEVQVGAARGGAGARTFWRWTLTLREGAAPETSAELTSVPARHAR
jgi:hypothetical protein